MIKWKIATELEIDQEKLSEIVKKDLDLNSLSEELVLDRIQWCPIIKA